MADRPETVTRRLTATPADIAAAAAILRGGGTVAFPTETVYGLGADATDGLAVAKIYAAKGRPQFNPLIAHVADAATAQTLGLFNADARALARAFWPGPLTLVVPSAPDGPVSDLARAGLDSIGLRVPDHPIASTLLRAVQRPVCAPSANRSGHISATTAAHVLADLDGKIDAVLDGGATAVGIESTIVACLPDGTRLLRAGGVPRAALERVLGRAVESHAPDSTLLAPGMLSSHYAPRAQVRLDVTAVHPGEAVLLFGPSQPGGLDSAGPRINLSPRGDLAEAAAGLFAALRTLDASGAASIAVSPIPTNGLGEAIRDRLQRAAVRE
ncbi:MAG: L-threonylcarbamoyladenylate synthase [Beijerinckiaceae bacterium]